MISGSDSVTIDTMLNVLDKHGDVTCKQTLKMDRNVDGNRKIQHVKFSLLSKLRLIILHQEEAAPPGKQTYCSLQSLLIFVTGTKATATAHFIYAESLIKNKSTARYIQSTS